MERIELNKISRQSTICAYTTLYERGLFPKVSKIIYWYSGVIAGMAGFIENEGAIQTFNLYGLPKVSGRKSLMIDSVLPVFKVQRCLII
tara:strand:- start:239 stop:505 length:267 start_codon:yes stop_codon:yes gene_type:complete